MTDHVAEFSLVRDDLAIRLQRRIGLVPREGLGVGRRCVAVGLIAWLPMAVWAWLHHRFLAGQAAEPLIQHFGVHARCLLAIPLFIACEATAQNVGRMVVQNLVASGIITDEARPKLMTTLVGLARIRDSFVPWLILAAIILGWTLGGPTIGHYHELLFAAAGPDEPLRLTFGAVWFLYVIRPVFIALLFLWVWRLILWTIALGKLSRLDLALVPTHADGIFGLHVLERTPAAFWPLLLGMSIVLGSTWAHDIVYHGVDVRTLALPAGIFAGTMTVIMLAPLLAFAPVLAQAKRKALAEYGALIARYGHLVHGKWILGEDPGEQPLLAAPELGPVADIVSLYEAVAAQRIAPIGKITLAVVLIPLLLPMIAVAALQIPIGKMLLTVLTKLSSLTRAGRPA